jgi:uncharacterized membrane protein
MARTIRNPLVVGADAIRGALGGAEAAGARLRGDAARPEIRRLDYSDLGAVLREGLGDLARGRTDAMFAVLLYPVIGLLAVWVAVDRSLLPLVFPAAAGFALLGPVAAIGVYEMSRRMERGEPARWTDAIRVLSSPSIGPILALGLILAGVFGVWMLVAQAIWTATLGPGAPESLAAFASRVLGTPEGWMLILVGCGAGFAFAAVVLATSWLAFPMLLDRDIGLPRAAAASFAAARANPGPAAAWGLIVAAALAAGSAPLFLGLILALPVLGHATWRLYRRAVRWPR